MRISNQMLNQTLSNNIRSNQAAVYEQTEQISSGKRIQRASDDPTSWTRAARLHGEQARLEQYERNAELLESKLVSLDASLGTIGDILQNASELAVRGSDATLSQNDRNALAEQVDQLLESLVAHGNSTYDGKYQFGGSSTETEPFAVTRNADGRIDSVAYAGASTTSKIGIAEGDALPVQLVGGDASSGVLLSDSADPFSALAEIRDRLLAGENLAGSGLQDEVDNAFERAIVGRASLGAYLEHVSFVSEVRANQMTQVAEDISDTESIDLTQAATALSEKQSAYEAALAMASKSMRTSLLDYL